MPIALTIAGSDSGGGAGVQADLKTFAALGVYGVSVITSVTAQNTLEVAGIHDLPPEFIALQLDTVVRDLPVDAIKTGMLSNPAIIRVVSERLKSLGVEKLVIDPVMVAKGGAALLRPEAEAELIERLLPLAYVVTPNLGEAEALAGMSIRNVEEMEESARRIHAKGSRHVVIKGGHLEGPPIDVFFDGRRFQYFEGERIETKSLHGTGCTFASAIAAELAKGAEVTEAIRSAKSYITTAIRLAEPIGHGFGPTHHFGALYQQAARYDIILQLEQAVAQLQQGGIAGLIPEVRSNLGLALPQAATLLEVAAWEGRIVRVGENICPVGGPRFGASRHVGTVILSTMRVAPRYRSAMNIRYGEDILQACQAVNLRVARLSRHDAPVEAESRGGSSLPWGVDESIQGLEAVPDIIYDLGAVRKEAMVWVLGHDAFEVARKVLMIRHRLSSH
ncbi:MAG TPA: bifunctional hydroxymethylpyrimidine kinase/phosphomethylpyrimidine kinase [Candidatus Tectomicrobia bacterium]|nr:bifunctional hydroxymethylpyrimidine kinase/phosphomethylpyrimidine kinase [Candidatus Tectomicrobia bacterium]